MSSQSFNVTRADRKKLLGYLESFGDDCAMTCHDFRRELRKTIKWPELVCIEVQASQGDVSADITLKQLAALARRGGAHDVIREQAIQ